MKKSSLAIILAIFIVPLALYYFIKTPSGNEACCAIAKPGQARVLQFSSPMCYDCKRIEGEIAPLRSSPEYTESIFFSKINISDRTPEVEQLIKKYNVDVVPTIVFLDKNGAQQCKIQGYAPKSKLRNCLDRIK